MLTANWLQPRCDLATHWHFFIDCDRLYQINGVHWTKRQDQVYIGETLADAIDGSIDQRMRVRLTDNSGHATMIFVTQAELCAYFTVSNYTTRVDEYTSDADIDAVPAMPGECVLIGESLLDPEATSPFTYDSLRPSADPYALTLVSKAKAA